MDPAKILVVDDDPLICELLERLLRQRGYTPVTTSDGNLALELLRAGSFQLLVADLLMPDRSGIELIREGHRLDQELEAIVITGHGSLDNAVEALRVGAYDYIQKPLNDVALFIHTVERALERRRLRQSNRNLVTELRAANERLEQQRTNELDRIDQIGRALASNLQREQIAELLQQALLTNEEYGVEAIALLAWEANREYSHFSIRSCHLLSARVVADINSQMAGLAAENGGPSVLNPVPPVNFGATEKFRGQPEWDRLLNGCDFEVLQVQNRPLGVLAMFGETEGRLSPEGRRVFHILARQAAVALNSIALFEQVREMARRDGLTHLYNHRHFMDLLQSETRRSRRYRRPLSLLFIDLDHFKQINDTLGHQAGDQVLAELSKLLLESVRETDEVARYGGEEFVVMLPEVGERDALLLAERLRRKVETRLFLSNGSSIHVTISVGVGSFSAEFIGTGEDLVRAADAALLAAKAAGRNCVQAQKSNVGLAAPPVSV